MACHFQAQTLHRFQDNSWVIPDDSEEENDGDSFMLQDLMGVLEQISS